MTAWKNAERRAAGLVDGKRHVRTSRYEAAPDVDGGRFSVEAKWRTRLPKLLGAAMVQAERRATPERPALVVVYQKGKRSGFAVMRTDDFRRLFKALLGEPVEPRRRRARKELKQADLFDGGNHDIR